MLVLIGILAMITGTSYARRTSCVVRGADNVVALTQGSIKCEDRCYLNIYVNLEKESVGETVVFVEVYDDEDNFIGNARLVINDGETVNWKHPVDKGTYFNRNIEEDKWYKLSIAEASCKVY